MIKRETFVFVKWFEKLSANIQDEIKIYIGRLLAGNFSNCKSVGEGIQELRINFQKGYRIYFMILDNKTILLLISGGTKGGNQKQQTKDIDDAKNKRLSKKERANMKNKNAVNKDWDISPIDFDAHFAKILSKSRKRINSFRKRVVKEYNETKDLTAFLEHLKVIAMAEHKIEMLAEKTKMKRPNIYRILSKNSNPTFSNLAAIARNLGFDFIIKAA